MAQKTKSVTLRPNTNLLADPANAFVVVKVVGNVDVPGKGDCTHKRKDRALPGECISNEEADWLSHLSTYEVICIETRD